jgi:cell division septal protein FtsQ
MSVGSRALGAPRTRAEQVRDRRARVTQVVEPTDRSARRRSRVRRRPRHRYDLSLGQEAAIALRLPSLFLPGFWSRFLSLLLLIPTLLAIRHGLSSPNFQVEAVTVQGTELLGDVQVRSIAGIARQSIFTVDTGQAVASLMAHPEISAARIKVSWPNEVQIEVQERRPVAVWNDGGRTWWLAKDGVAFIEREAWPGMVEVMSAEPVLDISDDPQRAAIDPEIVAGLERLSADLPKGATLQYNTLHGFGFADPRGWQAYFGAYGDMDSKVAVYQAIVRHLLSEEIKASVVSVEQPSTPYYRTAR